MCSLERYIVTEAHFLCGAGDLGVTAAVISGHFV